MTSEMKLCEQRPYLQTCPDKSDWLLSKIFSLAMELDMQNMIPKIFEITIRNRNVWWTQGGYQQQRMAKGIMPMPVSFHWERLAGWHNGLPTPCPQPPPAGIHLGMHTDAARADFAQLSASMHDNNGLRSLSRFTQLTEPATFLWALARNVHYSTNSCFYTQSSISFTLHKKPLRSSWHHNISEGCCLNRFECRYIFKNMELYNSPRRTLKSEWHTI